MPEEQVRDTSIFGRIMRKSKEEPIVTVGSILTCAALTSAVYHLRRGNKVAGNRMLFYRVLTQGLTVLALVGYGYLEHQKKKQRLADEAAGVTGAQPKEPKFKWEE
ncbi:Respiratory supercomplex factor 1, mitochondrial [Tieghemiomyces parasiticus]|uniref:Respiratory supercomplex factor 1, mitochondrial n=1 Tax=Tieghemiomyces parasiticus TaxID=78921 RepID=A0A9W8E242_9FUNG|nr:Respiratory supercomplex factor 1, mitochondrial [Tieghemiomyces parasiticus]